MVQLLADAKCGVDRFLFEAKMCARRQYGFAAMLTAFSVILGIAEAVSEQTRNEELFKWFVSQMSDTASWIVLPHSASPAGAEVIGKKLAQTRDSLAHQFSLPSDVELVNSVARVRNLSGRDPDKYFIGTREFVDEVRKTAGKIVESSGRAVFDSNPRDIDRRVANRVEGVKGTISSASVSVCSTQISGTRESKNGAA